MNRQRLRGSEGTSLILALAFLALLGVFTAAILTVADANFKTTQVARTRTDALYGADAGADYAIEQMRTSSTTTCPSTSTAISPIPTVNGATTAVTYTCMGGTSTTPVSTMLGSYSVIATGQYGIYVGGSAGSSPPLTLNIYGDAYSYNRDDLVVGSSGDANKLVINGDLALPGSSPCAFDATTDPMVTDSCLINQSAPSFTTPTVYVTTTNALSSKTSGNCTILYPGEYGPNGRALPTFSSSKGYYFASGTYYFNGAGNVNLIGSIQGGAPGSVAGTLTSLFSSRCPGTYANDLNAKVLQPTYNYTGSGATIILGGNTTLNFGSDNNTQVEIFPRVSPTGSPDAAATDGVSLWARMDSTSGATGSTYTKSTQYINYVTSGSGSPTADVVWHGLAYTPDNKLQTAPLQNTDAGGAAQWKGGVYTEKIYLVMNNNTGTAPIAGSPGTVVSVARTVTFTVVTQQPGGGVATTIQVVASYPTTANGQPTILSWRKV